MVKSDNLTNIEVGKKPPAPIRNARQTTASQWRISCEHFNYKRLVAISGTVIFIVTVATVPAVLLRRRKTTTSTTTTTTTTTSSSTITTTAADTARKTRSALIKRIVNETLRRDIKKPNMTEKLIETLRRNYSTNATSRGMTLRTKISSPNMLTNTTKWKQDGITVFYEAVLDESTPDQNPMYMADNETIYLAEFSQNRVIEIKLDTGNFSIVANGNPDEDGIEKFFRPIDIVVDKYTDSIIICEQGDHRIIRWPRRNTTAIDIIISSVQCNGLAMDGKGYLYASDWLKREVRRWEMGIDSSGTVVAGGNGEGNAFGQLKQPKFLTVTKEGSVYVVDKGNHRVMKWMKNAKEGIVVAGSNGIGSSARHLNSPTGVVVDHLENVYVTDTQNHRVMRWNKGASEGSIIAGGNGKGNETNQLDLPSDLLFDQYGNLYVYDSANYRIQKFCIESY